MSGICLFIVTVVVSVNMNLVRKSKAGGKSVSNEYLDTLTKMFAPPKKSQVRHKDLTTTEQFQQRKTLLNLVKMHSKDC